MVYLLGMSFLLNSALHAQNEQEAKNTNGKTMTWTTKSEAARKLAMEGAKHHRNVEYERAYEKFLEAIDQHSNFTIALVFLATMTRGQTKEMYAKKAMESAADKTEGEKLFASLANEKATPEANREVWTKLHDMFPDGAMIGYYYVITRATPQDRFDAAQKYMKQFPNEAAIYNDLGYYYMNEKKDFGTAKKYFEKYIQLYPEGSNPYDSMGEFYALTGDAANAEKYYTLALEKYPYTNSSLVALKKIEDDKKKNTAKKN